MRSSRIFFACLREWKCWDRTCARELQPSLGSVQKTKSRKRRKKDKWTGYPIKQRHNTYPVICPNQNGSRTRTWRCVWHTSMTAYVQLKEATETIMRLTQFCMQSALRHMTCSGGVLRPKIHAPENTAPLSLWPKHYARSDKFFCS